MVSFLRIFLSILWIFMVYMVISTSLESSLFKEWDFLAAIPWMRATLWDFYANVLVIFIWVVYRERHVAIMVIWAILFFLLGSIGTIGYTLIQLFNLREGEEIHKILERKKS
jgi:predicted membrane protein